jgi:hypothetical protein
VSEQVSIVGEYYRSRSGRFIHLAPCSHMGSAVRWNYAAGMSLHEVAAEVGTIEWMRLCRWCWPAAAFGGGS